MQLASFRWMRSCRRWCMTHTSPCICHLTKNMCAQLKLLQWMTLVQHQRRRSKHLRKQSRSARQNSRTLTSLTQMEIRYVGHSIWADARRKLRIVDARKEFTFAFSASATITAWAPAVWRNADKRGQQRPHKRGRPNSGLPSHLASWNLDVTSHNKSTCFQGKAFFRKALAKLPPNFRAKSPYTFCKMKFSDRFYRFTRSPRPWYHGTNRSHCVFGCHVHPPLPAKHDSKKRPWTLYTCMHT